jgi:hypothetical protein
LGWQLNPEEIEQLRTVAQDVWERIGKKILILFFELLLSDVGKPSKFNWILLKTDGLEGIFE